MERRLPSSPTYTVRVKRQLKNKDGEKREKGRVRERKRGGAGIGVPARTVSSGAEAGSSRRGLPHSPRTRDTRTPVPTVRGAAVLVKVDTTPRDRQPQVYKLASTEPLS